jgi:hypothetical protein
LTCRSRVGSIQSIICPPHSKRLRDILCLFEKKKNPAPCMENSCHLISIADSTRQKFFFCVPAILEQHRIIIGIFSHSCAKFAACSLINIQSGQNSFFMRAAAKMLSFNCSLFPAERGNFYYLVSGGGGGQQQD